jgi:hypothetical protein
MMFRLTPKTPPFTSRRRPAWVYCYGRQLVCFIGVQLNSSLLGKAKMSPSASEFGGLLNNCSLAGGIP